MIIQRNIDVFVGYYDFSAIGGAIGSYDLNVPVYQNSMVTEFGVCWTVLPTSAGGATISFDIVDTSVSPPVTGIGFLFPAINIGAFTSTTTGYYGTAAGSGTAGIIGVGVKSTSAFSIGMSIGAFALTAGKCQVWAKVVGFDF